MSTDHVRLACPARFLWFGLCVALGVVGFSPPAAGYVRETVDDQPGVYLYWARRDVQIGVNAKGSDDVAFDQVAAAVEASMRTWNAVSCTDLELSYSGQTDEDTTNLTRDPLERPSGQNLIRWREDTWPPIGATAVGIDAAMLALTVVVYDAKTGQIRDADMDLNGVHYKWVATDEVAANRVDVQNVVTHEIGHMIGLGHSDEFLSTMYWEQGPGERSKRNLHQDDVVGVCQIYPANRPTILGPDQVFPTQQLIGGGCGFSPIQPPAMRRFSLFLSMLFVFGHLFLSRRTSR